MRNIYRINGSKSSHLNLEKRYSIIVHDGIESMGRTQFMNAGLQIIIDPNLPLLMWHLALKHNPGWLAVHIRGCLPEFLEFTSANLATNKSRMEECFLECHNFCNNYQPAIAQGKIKAEDIDLELAARHFIFRGRAFTTHK